MNTWLESLIAFNKGKAKYVVPKKGSADYKKVKAMQAKLDAKKK